MKKVFKDRGTLYFVLGIVMVCVFTLTMAYAALNAVLEINGNAEVVASTWDIRLENPKVKSGSVNTKLPVITNNKEASFSATLNKPGDFYEFTIDVVNNGSIDAMIDSIEKLPSLTTEQSKFLNYIIEYENGESISTKQLVDANSFVRLKVKVEFRKDISSTDLPTSQNVLDLSFKLNYVQADEKGTSNVVDNGVKKVVKVVKGDGTQKSDEICIENECFYVMYSDGETVTMLSKYNLHVGNKTDSTNGVVALESPTGIQDETARGWFRTFTIDNPIIGVKSFSLTNYWKDTTSTYPAYIYASNSILYNYVENYKTYLGTLGVTPIETRLITKEELESLGCKKTVAGCNNGAPEWVYLTSYWSGTAYTSTQVFVIDSTGVFSSDNYNMNNGYGVRPVVTISRTSI